MRAPPEMSLALEMCRGSKELRFHENKRSACEDSEGVLCLWRGPGEKPKLSVKARGSLPPLNSSLEDGTCVPSHETRELERKEGRVTFYLGKDSGRVGSCPRCL